MKTAKEEFWRRNAERERRKQDADARRKFGGSTFRHPDRVARFTFLVSVFTGCLFFAALVQGWAFIQSERAFVSPSAMNFTPPTQSDQSALFNVKIVNSGRSTANIKHHLYAIAAALPPDPVYPVMKDSVLSPVVPGGFITFQIKFAPLEPDEIALRSQRFLYLRPYRIRGRFYGRWLQAKRLVFRFRPQR